MPIREIYFLPPLAIARLGGSETPLDCFVWDTDKSIHGGNRTAIEPAVSLRVMADGSLRPFMPNAIQFRDGDLLRPVAPFFELWATVEEGGRCEASRSPCGLLKEFGVDLDSVEYTHNGCQPEGAATHPIGRLRLYRARDRVGRRSRA